MVSIDSPFDVTALGKKGQDGKRKAERENIFLRRIKAPGASIPEGLACLPTGRWYLKVMGLRLQVRKLVCLPDKLSIQGLYQWSLLGFRNNLNSICAVDVARPQSRGSASDASRNGDPNSV